MRGGARQVGEDFTQGPLMKQLMVFATPMILASLLQQVYSLVDLAMVGQFVGSAGTVGVSTGGELNDVILPLAQAITAGGQVYLSQIYGAKKEHLVKKTVGTLITMCLILAVFCMALQTLGCDIILNLLNCPTEDGAFEQARNYMLITAIGIPFVFLYNTMSSMMRSRGESKTPLMSVIVATVVNIIANYIFLAIIPLEASGVAIGTIMSQIVSAVYCGAYMAKHNDVYGVEFKLSFLTIDVEAAKVILSIGIPQAARSILVRFSGLWVKAQINSYGLVYSATNSVGNKLEKFLDVYSNAMANAAAAMIGQNLGAKKYDRAKTVVHDTLLVSSVFAAVVVLASIFIPRQMFRIFSTDEEVISLGVVYLRIMIGQYVLTAIVNAYQSMVVGSGNSKLNFIVGIFDGIICKIGLGVLFAIILGMGAQGYWWGISLSRGIPAVICVAYFYSNKWQNRELIKEDRPS